MTLTVGDKVVYPGRGPCLIGGIVQKIVCGMSTRFWRLALLDDSGAELFVPIDNIRGVHTRPLLDRSQIPELLGNLKPRARVTTNRPTAKSWRERELNNAKLFGSGSIFDLAELVGSLTQLSGTKTLTPQERESLYRARKLMICEIAEVMDESKSAAEARIDTVLEPGKNKTGDRTEIEPLSV